MEPADLANRPLAELLVELHAARATGTLHLERARTTKQLGFADGFLVAAESSLPREAPIARLEDAGEIGAEAATRARSLAKERRSSEAAALAATKAVEPKRLIAAMRER
ncbi:MAG: DUF4388 domain-containing protein, partial [Myxococcales bacterium]|nr:DUF4388 domain-containing protein [Myxococcales bacterium]